MTRELPRSETAERYALGLAKADRLPPDPAPEATAARTAELVRELETLGAHGWPERRTWYTRDLPPGCRPCLEGRGSNLCLTTRCDRDCFFCFNPKPRRDVRSVHGRSVADDAEAAGLLGSLGVRSVGLSGGEPLLDPARTLATVRELRARMSPDVRIDLYTNGGRFTPALLRELKDAGVDGLRLNLAARGYNPAPAALARLYFDDVSVEIPAVPGEEERLAALVGDLEAANVPRLIVHELFASGENVDSLARRGYFAKREPRGDALSWSAVAGSEAAALATLVFALKTRSKVSVYYCSCGTQEWIGERALERTPTS